MENIGLEGIWINSKNPAEEICIATYSGGDYYTLEYDKNENGFQKSEHMDFFHTEGFSGFCRSEYFGTDNGAFCDGKVFRVNDKVFIRKT